MGQTRIRMEPQSVLTQTIQQETKQHTLKHRWMRYFFAEDASPDNCAVVELQRRATWIGLALTLQALNEIDHNLYMPLLGPFGSLIPLVLILGSFYAIWLAFRPANKRRQHQYTRKHPTRLQRFLLICTLLTTIAGGIEFGRGIVMCFSPPQLSNDGTSLDTNAALLLLQGRNPYTDSNMLDLARRFPIQPNWTTPLRRGQFANMLNYPSAAALQSVLDTDLRSGSAPEFESKVSYPALSFLTLLPFALFKDYNVLPLYLLSYLVLVAIAWKVVRPELRAWVLLLALANVPMWSSTIGANLDIFNILLLVLSWLLWRHRWSSAIFLGLAFATKQPAWFFIPFYAIMIWRHYSLKEAIYRLTIAGCLGLAFNLPFIIWNAHAWIAGILAPVADPMFPMGVGIIGLSVTHLLPFFPEWVYTALEGIAMLLSLAWYWRLCREHPEAAMLLSVVPLFLAWRSLPSYFYCAAFPLFILMAAKTAPLFRRSTSATDASTDNPEQQQGALAPAGVRASS